MIPVAGTLPFFLRVQAKSRAAYSAAQKMHHGRFCENRIRYAAFWPGHAKRSLILPARSSCANQNWTLMSLIHSRKERRTPIAASHGPGSKPSAPLSGIARPLPQSPLCSTVQSQAMSLRLLWRWLRLLPSAWPCTLGCAALFLICIRSTGTRALPT